MGNDLETYFTKEEKDKMIRAVYEELFFHSVPQECPDSVDEDVTIIYTRRGKRLTDFLLREKGPEYDSSSFPAASECNLCDFALFLSVMKNKSAYQDTLSIILDEEDLQLKKVNVEQVILNHTGKRAIRLDAWAEDTRDRHLSTEMQLDTRHDNMPKRARFYQSLMDTPVLKSGKDTKYRNLPSTIIIFITIDDLFACDRAAYTFTPQCEEVPGLHLQDGTKKIFLNMSSKNGRPELISLLQYMKNSTLDNPEITVRDERLCRLDQVVQEVKQSEEWEDYRMNIYETGMERGIKQGIEQGMEQGIKQGIEQGMEQGIKQGIEQGMEQGIKQGIEQGMEQGIKQGMEQGIKKERERGIFLMIRDYLEEGVSPERICKKLQKNFSMSPEEASEKYRLYFNTPLPQ